MNLMRRLVASPQLCITLVVLVLYGMAFNPYVPPQNGDDISYFHGALSIAAGEGFKEQGKWIIDWPPVQSSLIALVMRLTGIRDYYIGKIFNGFAVLVSLLLAHRLMVAERRIQPTLCCLLIALFPTSLHIGSGGQADFTYFAFSMIFFLLIEKLRRERSLHLAILCGILLGIVSLTRWQGVLMGICLVFQSLAIGLKPESTNFFNRLKSVWQECLAAAIGGGVFVIWEQWLQICARNGTAAASNYEYHGSAIWHVPRPIELFIEILNLLTQLKNIVVTLVPTFSLPLLIIVWIFFGLTCWGGVLRIRKYGWLATDVFLISMILLLATYAYKESRYAIPIAPFLLDYFFRGLQDVHSRIIEAIRGSQKSAAIQRIAFFVFWISGLLAFDATLLFYGDGETLGPACQVLLPNNRAYLRGYHRDLYDICKQLPKDYPNAIVASDKFHKQLIRHYSGLESHFVGYAPDAKYSVFIQVDPACLPKRFDELTKIEFDFPPSLKGRLTNPRKSGYVTLWDVDAMKVPVP